MSTRRILVVDDEPHITHVVSLKLTNAGFEITQAHDGEEALDIATRGGYELVISDLQMPYLDGLELAKALYSRSATRELPVLLLTARGYAVDDSDLERTNIRDVLTKPFSPRRILEKVYEVIDPSSDAKGAIEQSEAA